MVVIVIEVIMKLTVVMEMVLDKEVDMGVNWEVDKELTKDVYIELKCLTLKTYWSFTCSLKTSVFEWKQLQDAHESSYWWSFLHISLISYLHCENSNVSYKWLPQSTLVFICLAPLCIINCIFKLVVQKKVKSHRLHWMSSLCLFKYILKLLASFSVISVSI